MSLVQRLITTAYQGGKGALKGGKGSVDDILRSTPLGGAPVSRSVGTIPDARSPISSITGSRLTGLNALQKTGRPFSRTPFISSPDSINNARYTQSGTQRFLKEYGRQPPNTAPNPGLNPRPTIPSGGQRVAPTTAFGGQNPIVGNVNTSKVPLAQAASRSGLGMAALGLLGLPTGAFGLAIGGAGSGSTPRKENEFNPGPLIDIQLDGIKFRNPFTGTSPAKLDPLEMRERYGGSGDMDAGPDVVSRKKKKPTIPEVIIDDSNGRVIPETQLRPEEVDTTTKLPPSAEQTMIDPYSYNLAVYGQGRNAAQSQTEMNKVRDLGLAINRSMFPQFNNTKTPNPMLQRMFPETYPGTLNALIEEKGVQKPGSMSQVDADNAIIDSSIMDDKYKVAAATGEVEGLLSAQAQESLRQQFLQGQLKRYSLDY